MPTMNFILDRFKVIETSEWGDDEPYLWVFWIVVDLNTINSKNFVVRIDNPGHGNLGSSGLSKGKSVPIPANIGSFSIELKPIVGFAMVGFVVIAWEEDNTPNSTVKQAYDATADTLNEFIKGRASDFSKPSAEEKAQLQKEIESKVRDIFSSAVHLTSPASWDPDNAIGSFQFLKELVEIPGADEPLVVEFKDESAHYTVTGRLGLFGQRVVALRALAVSGHASDSVFTVFDQGGIYRSDDGKNPGGGDNTAMVYAGGQRVVEMIGHNGHVLTAFDGGGVYSSPDGTNLGGGGNTAVVYDGTQKVRAMTSFEGGIVTAFREGGGVYLSPDGENLGGGGNTTLVYAGQEVIKMVHFQQGVITAFSYGSIYRSSDGRDVGGGGNTVLVYGGQQTAHSMVNFDGGILTAFSGGGVYLSPDGENLGGGGNTVLVYSGEMVIAMIPFQRGVITAFSDGSIYRSPDGRDVGGGGNTILVYSGKTKLRAMTAFAGGIVAAFENGNIWLSPDGDNLGGGGNTTMVYPPLF